MRTVNIRQFQRNFYKEIKSLPVLVTRRKHAVFVVSKPKDLSEVTVKTEEQI
jgi:hypothetical protein